MKIDYVNKGAVKLMGFSYKTTMKDGQNLKDIPQFWKDYTQSGQMERLHKENIKNHDEYGCCVMGKPGTGEITYIIGVEVEDAGKIPGGYACLELPLSRYAVFSTEPSNEKNFSDNIQKLWGYVWSTWLKETKEKVKEDGISYELYNETCMTQDAKVCEVYIPLESTTPPPTGS